MTPSERTWNGTENEPYEAPLDYEQCPRCPDKRAVRTSAYRWVCFACWARGVISGDGKLVSS